MPGTPTPTLTQPTQNPPQNKHHTLLPNPCPQEETCYVQVIGMVTADVLENDQEYDDVSWEG